MSYQTIVTASENIQSGFFRDFFDDRIVMSIQDITQFDNTSAKYKRSLFNFSQWNIIKPSGVPVVYGNLFANDKYIDPPSLLPEVITLDNPEVGIYTIELLQCPTAVSGQSYSTGECVLVGSQLYTFISTTSYAGTIVATMMPITVNQLSAQYTSTFLFFSELTVLQLLRKLISSLFCKILKDYNYATCEDSLYEQINMLFGFGFSLYQSSGIVITPDNQQVYTDVFNYINTINEDFCC